jgi:hypothetical protein
VCGIASADQIPHPSTWTRFRQRAGSARLQLILGDLLRQLAPTGVYKASAIAVDPTFIKAYSKRDPKNNTVGYSDPEARLRIEDRNVTLGYGVHLAVNVAKGLIVGFIVAPANRNEKRVLPHLLIRLVMAGFHVKTLIADTQYSSNAVRILCSLCKITAIIPYPEEPVQTCEGAAARRQTLPCPRSKKTSATVSQAKRRRTQQRLAQRLLRPKPATNKRTGERDHTRHIMRNGLIHHRHRSPQTQKTRPNPLTNPTPPNIHTKSKTAIASRALVAYVHRRLYRVYVEQHKLARAR